MKKKNLLFAIPMAFLMASCGCYTIHHATNNPVGTKSGTARAGMFVKDADFSYNKAAKKGGINRIGTTEIKTGPFRVKTTVTGE